MLKKVEVPLVIYEASGFMQRLRGLLFRSELTNNEALHITSCNDVHSFSMRYDLDIVYLNQERDVIRTEILKPNRWSYCKEATSVLEFKAGYAAMHGFVAGTNVSHVTTRAIRERHG